MTARYFISQFGPSDIGLVTGVKYTGSYAFCGYYDLTQTANGDTVFTLEQIWLKSELVWNLANVNGSSSYGAARIGTSFNRGSHTRTYKTATDQATGPYWVYDYYGTPVSSSHAAPYPVYPDANSWARFIYSEGNQPTKTFSASSVDRTESIYLQVEIRDGVNGYVFTGYIQIDLSIPKSTYAITLHLNGGMLNQSTVSPQVQTKEYGQTYTFPTPTKSDAVFRGWNSSADGSGSYYSSTWSLNQPLTAYAIWYDPHYVTYNGNGPGGRTVSNPPATQAKVHGTDLALSTQKPTTTDGYAFKNWNTLPNPTSGTPGITYSPGQSYSTEANLALYAQWYAPYAITYNANQGSDTASQPTGIPGNQVKTHDIAIALSSARPSRPGYRFSNWNTAANGTGTSYAPGQSYSGNANLTLYAIWEAVIETKTLEITKLVRTEDTTSTTEADEGTYAYIEFGYSYTGALGGSIVLGLSRTVEGGTEVPVTIPSSAISGATTKASGYGTVSGTVKMHDTASLPITNKYTYKATATLAGANGVDASAVLQKAFFTISFLGDGVSGQTPGHGIAFGMPATRAAFEVGPSMPAYIHSLLNVVGSTMALTAGKVPGLTPPMTRIFSNGIVMTNPATANDQGWIRVTGTGEGDTVLEIATGDDGGTGEQIVVRQYNTSNAVAREAKLLDTGGNTNFPGALDVYGGGFKVRRAFFETPASTAAGWKRVGTITGYAAGIIFIGGGYNYGAPTQVVLGISTMHGAGTARLTQIACSYVNRYNQARLVHIDGGNFYLELYQNAQSSGGTAGGTDVTFIGRGNFYPVSTITDGSGSAAATVTFNIDPVNGTAPAQIGQTFVSGGTVDGYHSLKSPAGSDGTYIRAGYLIPLSSGGDGTIGTTSWPYKYGHFVNLYIGSHDVQFSTHNNTGQDCNTFATNGITYYTSNGPATSIGATTTDGALYMQKYSDAWQAQIAQDYRNGRLFVRGKSSGTWQSWQAVYDTAHKPSISSADLTDIRLTWASQVTTTDWFLAHDTAATGTPLFRGISPANVKKVLGIVKTVLNSGGGYSDVTLASSAANFNRMRIYFYTNESYYDSVDIIDPNNKYVLLSTSRGENGSPNKLWTKSKLVQISGTKIYVKAYAELGINSNNAYGVNGYNYIGIGVVVGWNE